MDCLFCKIIQGDIPGHVFYEDEACVAILDIKPLALGHALVLPRSHAANILEVASGNLGPVFQSVQNVVLMLKNRLSPDGFTIGINHGQISGQTVDHLHIHIIPRWNNDGGGSLHSVINNPPKESLEEIKLRLKNKKVEKESAEDKK